MRLFVALDIDDAIRERIARFIETLKPFFPDGRWARPESLHVTLKFIGEQPEQRLEQIMRALESIQANPVSMNFQGYGFFPTPRSARVFWAGIEAASDLSGLASTVDHALSKLGIEQEKRAFNPHLTLARAPGSSGAPRQSGRSRANRNFQLLQEKLVGLDKTEFGSMTARQFFLYRSQLSPKGSEYTKLAAFALA